ncbi:hypothetical protein BC833DRAFT_601504 [Globomyces pollinis-pini]|nr:hypothetical protein BC833DRAFT_601504 [Globomyces pollinis-pini]
MKYTVQYEDASAERVFFTGEFDHWGQTVQMNRVDNGFITEIDTEFESLKCKFVVDGKWVTSDRYPKVIDDQGNENNFITPELKNVDLQSEAQRVISKWTVGLYLAQDHQNFT